jgi:hypothetical protein
MMHMQRLVLGVESDADVFFGTSQLNNKVQGNGGGVWHSHAIGGGIDDAGTVGTDEYMQQSLCSLTLAYPKGFAHAEDGNLNIIRGSHLFRDPSNCRAEAGPVGDEEMRQGWLKGRLHPITQQPMDVEQVRHSATLTVPLARHMHSSWRLLTAARVLCYCCLPVCSSTGLSSCCSALAAWSPATLTVRTWFHPKQRTAPAHD